MLRRRSPHAEVTLIPRKSAMGFHNTVAEGYFLRVDRAMFRRSSRAGPSKDRPRAPKGSRRGRLSSARLREELRRRSSEAEVARGLRSLALGPHKTVAEHGLLRPDCATHFGVEIHQRSAHRNSQHFDAEAPLRKAFWKLAIPRQPTHSIGSPANSP